MEPSGPTFCYTNQNLKKMIVVRKATSLQHRCYTIIFKLVLRAGFEPACNQLPFLDLIRVRGYRRMWSEWPGSNWQHSAWRADTLSIELHSHCQHYNIKCFLKISSDFENLLCFSAGFSINRYQLKKWSRRQDSNLRSFRTGLRYQSC